MWWQHQKRWFNKHLQKSASEHIIFFLQEYVILGVLGSYAPVLPAGNRSKGQEFLSIYSPHFNKEKLLHYYHQSKRPTLQGKQMNVKCSCWKCLDSTLFQKNIQNVLLAWCKRCMAGKAGKAKTGIPAGSMDELWLSSRWWGGKGMS